ncbi:hypothetical protein ACFX19_014492 [Malus domestica]
MVILLSAGPCIYKAYLFSVFRLSCCIAFGISSFRFQLHFPFSLVLLRIGFRLQDWKPLCEWAYKEWLQGHPENVVDRKIIGGFIPQELERALRIAFWCVQIDERRRPPMREVVKVLDSTLSVDPPPPPFSCQGPRDDEEEP